MKKDIFESGAVEVHGARVHNLKNIDVAIPHEHLTVITGLSGCGKSSLAFDTIFAEGQRRYIETFSTYARNMMGSLERPDVDEITGLAPVISIEQKTVSKNPRSTIGTITEIYDFFRLLYARLGEPRSYLSGLPMVKYTSDKIISLLLKEYKGRRIYILAPIVKNRKGHYRELFETLRKKGYLNVRVDNTIRPLAYGMKLDRYKNHSIELIVDRLKVDDKDVQRLRDTVAEALRQGEKQMMVMDADTEMVRYYSQLMMDPQTGLSYPEAAPHTFSFNSPHGACPHCKGLGYISVVDEKKVIPDKSKSIYAGAIEPLGKYHKTYVFTQIEQLLKQYGVNIKTPVCDLPEQALKDVLFGPNSAVRIGDVMVSPEQFSFSGVVKYIQNQQQYESEAAYRRWCDNFFSQVTCEECAGTRLDIIPRHYFVDDHSIADVVNMDLAELYEWTQGLEMRVDSQRRVVAEEILKEIRGRLKFLLDVGLGYLSLGRAAATLSGGESQRIRLATQIGSTLVNVLYILDEPSIGLHQRDNDRLIKSLKQLRDDGNSVVVVEHDRDIMENADYIVDIGPGAGRHGGEVVFQGTPAQMHSSDKSVTAAYLNGRKSIPIPKMRRSGSGKFLEISGASGNNLKGVDLKLPLGKIICITGVSGSGKSSLINGTLRPLLSKRLYRSIQAPLPYKDASGLENIDKMVTVDQSPIGRTPRSNPATYTGLFTEIRKLFVSLPEAQIRGYKPGRFSFNVAGGRCEVCKGNGYRTIEMNFLPDVLVPCEECHGHRYNRETLEVRFKGKSIADVLEMTINQAVEFFAVHPTILRKLKVLQEIGLGYVKLGQPSSTLSGGENQRVKLAAELAKRDTGKTLFLLDEPTTGLHFEDIKVLLKVFDKLADRGNTVVVIEHNMDVIKCADHIVDLGPEGGRDGGMIIAEGTPEQIAETDTPTGRYLAREFQLHAQTSVDSVSKMSDAKA